MMIFRVSERGSAPVSVTEEIEGIRKEDLLFDDVFISVSIGNLSCPYC